MRLRLCLMLLMRRQKGLNVGIKVWKEVLCRRAMLCRQCVAFHVKKLLSISCCGFQRMQKLMWADQMVPQLVKAICLNMALQNV